MSIPSTERRKFLKAASYQVPAVITLLAAPTFATSGSKIKVKCDQGIGNGPDGCSPGNSDHNQDSNDDGTENRGGNPL